MLPCLACGTPLPPEATGCPICLRGRTKQEMARGYAHLREQEARSRARPYRIAAAALALGACAVLGWRYRGAAKLSLDTARTRAAAWSDRFTDPKRYAPSAGRRPD